MQKNWQIGSLFGIPLFIDPSWLFILLFVTAINAGDLDPTFRSLVAWGAGLVMALLLFGSVLLHELGHSLVARSQGIKVNSITLFIFGGIAAIDRESKTPGQAFQVAIAGPVVSLILSGLFYLLSKTIASSGLGYTVVLDIATINLVLALFNLIPGLPLDGGQVLKAAVWKITGNRFAGVHWAARTGKVIGGVAIALGLLLVLKTGDFTAIWLTLIGSFVFRNADAYDQLTKLQETLLELVASDAMTRDYRVIDGTMSLRDFADQYILADARTPIPYYAAAHGRYQGLVTIEDLQRIERSRWEIDKLETIAHSLSEIPTVVEKTNLVEVIKKLENLQLKRLTVLSPADAIAGVIDRGDIVRAIASKLNLAISEVEIKRIKAEGTYPAGFQLGAIVKGIENRE